MTSSTAPTQSPGPGARIVVGVDGSASSIDALRWAQQLADIARADVVAVTAWRIPVTIGWAIPGWDPEIEAHETLTKVVAKVYGDRPRNRLRMVVREGTPAAVLLKASADALMLVVGSRGLGGFNGLLLGSVSRNCVEHANCPVLVLHSEPPKTPDDRAGDTPQSP